MLTSVNVVSMNQSKRFANSSANRTPAVPESSSAIWKAAAAGEGSGGVGTTSSARRRNDSSILGVAVAITIAYGITSDSNANVYTTGYTFGNLDGQTLTGTRDLFVVKYDANGVKQWTRLLGISGADTAAFGITSDSSGNVYTTGYTNGNLDGQILTGQDDLFVVKYDANGVKQ